MARIAYALSGEGRGHATRVGTMLDELGDQHEFLLLASGMAYDFLKSRFQHQAHVQVFRIPGLEFHYRGQRLHYPRSLWHSLPFLYQLRQHVFGVAEQLRRFQTDLAITDFEPLLPRAARLLKIPLISFDHQHFLRVSNLAYLPWRLRWKGWLIGCSIGLFCSGQRETIVSSFFKTPLRRGWERAIQVGVLLRPEILQAEPHDAGHLLVYLRRFAKPQLLDALRQSGRVVHIYGVGKRQAEGNLHFYEIDDAAFIRDMASCHAVISNAGNQLVGEAIHLQKPFLALPESGNFEQALNAHFLKQSGLGMTFDYDTFTLAKLQTFLDAVPRLSGTARNVCVAANVCVAGNAAAVAAIQRCLAECQRHAAAALVEPVAA